VALDPRAHAAITRWVQAGWALSLAFSWCHLWCRRTWPSAGAMLRDRGGPYHACLVHAHLANGCPLCPPPWLQVRGAPELAGPVPAAAPAEPSRHRPGAGRHPGQAPGGVAVQQPGRTQVGVPCRPAGWPAQPGAPHLPAQRPLPEACYVAACGPGCCVPCDAEVAGKRVQRVQQVVWGVGGWQATATVMAVAKARCCTRCSLGPARTPPQPACPPARPPAPGFSRATRRGSRAW
jgi:hypothetical protein